MKKRPTVVCLCGSTRFGRAFREANLRETLAGKIVLTVGCDTKSDDDLLIAGELTPKLKAMLDELHLAKIDMADEILVLDATRWYCTACRSWVAISPHCGKEIEQRPYIGDSTRREIAYAEGLGKVVRYLSKEQFRATES